MEDKVTHVYSIFNTSFGLCGIVLSESGVVKFILPGMSKGEIVSVIGAVIASRRRSNLKLRGLRSMFRAKRGISEFASASPRNRSAPRNDISRGLYDLRFKVLEDLIKRYFDGERIDCNFPLDLSYSTAFQRSVYKITKTIPYGEVKSYKWVAKKIGLTDASRAVGGALSRNPIPLLIPCHRVIREDGGMGGFTAHGGIDLKMKMLKMEGIQI